MSFFCCERTGKTRIDKYLPKYAIPSLSRKKRGYNLSLMNEVVKLLQNGELLPEKYKDHALTGNWKGFRDCHIQPDWILVYRVYHNKLLLVLSRTGTHSDLDLS